jgi:hypothetical protein
VVQDVTDASATERSSAAEYERDATNDDASDHAAPVRRRAPIYHVIDVQRRSNKYRNQECIAEPATAFTTGAGIVGKSSIPNSPSGSVLSVGRFPTYA